MVKALVFDLMGTCVDWHSVVSDTLASNMDIDTAKAVATDWRAGFFAEIHRQFAAKESPEDIDVTHLRVLNSILQSRNISLSDGAKKLAVASWHHQKG
jgi:FMN phosphatase YigB (HAD superfamily)